MLNINYHNVLLTIYTIQSIVASEDFSEKVIMYRKNWFYNGNACSTMLVVIIMSVFKYVNNYIP